MDRKPIILDKKTGSWTIKNGEVIIEEVRD